MPTTSNDPHDPDAEYTQVLSRKDYDAAVAAGKIDENDPNIFVMEPMDEPDKGGEA